ncbi:glycosyltransferase family 2 protein [Xanthomarina gelatinilytica]|uniref:glycosyltransferase family 2 protein n=1 Tax=Xanthomarina gelatinilytica TaxID=1137281 RepID=UPI003AA88995
MSLSIVTPHFNDLEGLKQIYTCLLKQTDASWDWVVVDDCSDDGVRTALRAYVEAQQDPRIQLLLPPEKSNASVCRNLGAEKATYQHLVFLDSDDVITEDFVKNRQVNFEDFVVFKHTAVLNKNGTKQVVGSVTSSYLDCFLKARFVWPITAILWRKDFFIAIGQFHPKLPRLQDVELAIRALQHSAHYQVLDNPVDFYYRVKPIRERKNFVQPVCEAVYLFISDLLDTSKLNKHQLQLLSGYYYLCIKYLERSGDVQEVPFVQKNLNLFYKKGYVNISAYLLGLVFLKFYQYKWISGTLFLRVNRRLFKP